MRKNPLFYEKTNANAFKIAFAKRKVYASLVALFCIFAVTGFAMTGASKSQFVGAGATSALVASVMLTGKIAGTETLTHNVDGTEKTAEESLVYKLKFENEQIVTKALTAFKEGDESYKAIKGLLEQVKKLEAGETEKSIQIRKDLDELGVKVKAMNELPAKFSQKSTAVILKENMASIKDLAKGSSMKDINLAIRTKALVQMSSITDNEQAFDIPSIGQLATRKLSLYDLLPKVTLGENNQGTVRYYDWDKDTIVRAAAAVAEGGTFPASTAKFKKYSIDLEKIGDTLPVTDEFFEDEQMFAAELERFLTINVALILDNQLANGDGTSNTLVGLFASMDEFDFTASGIANSVQDASIYDLCIKASESITSSGGSKYSPDVAIMNIADINNMNLKKDAMNNYVLPPFVSRDGKNVAGMIVIECNAIAAGSMIVGDRRFATIYEKGGITLSRGYDDGQYVKDEMTLKARKRTLFLIRNADKNGWTKISDIDAALAGINKA